MRVLVSGGAGFIGSALCRRLAANPDHRVVNLDSLTYAGNLASLQQIENRTNYRFVKADIRDGARVGTVLEEEDIDVVIHLAAESHVDRSIDGPEAFVETNIVGTYRFLAAVLAYWKALPADRRERFRFLHVSTDEVFGDLPFGDELFTEETPYAPSSPYAATKAASDHLVRAWGKTYGLPVLVSNCSNNYGPFQFPEKLIPLVILNAVNDRPLPVYGKGENVRDWLFVDDHAAGLETVASRGQPGRSYNFGARSERRNIDVVRTICRHLDRIRQRPGGGSHEDLITMVTDRPGHDRRYAVDPSRVESELDWRPLESFDSGIARTIEWYLANEWWWRPIRERNYSGDRLGVGVK
jgi:dTDP-glucose 4,6-dehydratase